MTFADLLAGAPVFLDANTLVYHFTLHPRFGPACTQLLERVARQELVAFTSIHVLSDATHRAMTLEAVAQFGWFYAGITQRLKKHPAQVQSLVHFRRVVDEVPHFGVHILVADWQIASLAAIMSQQYGLLTNDALIAVLMRQHGLANLASNDSDFDRVPGLTRYAPA